MSYASGGSIAVLDEPEPTLITVPDSPAALWVSTSKPVTATGADWTHVPADVASWVAPPMTVCS